MLVCPARVLKVEEGMVNDNELVADQQDNDDDYGVGVGLISEKERKQVHQRCLREPCEEVLRHEGHSY